MTTTQGVVLRWRLAALVACLVALLPLLSGCGSKKKDAVLTGKITYKDGPVKGGTITLHPTGGGKDKHPGTINADGSYIVSGATPGDYKVTIETEQLKRSGAGGGYQMPPGMKPPADVKMEKPDLPTENAPSYTPVPQKYWNVQSTDLTVTITGGKQTKDFPLSD